MLFRLVFMTLPVSQCMGKGWVRIVMAAFLALMFGLNPVLAHEQQTLTIILNEEGAVVGNISDPTFVQGNSVWFKMYDTTENATMQIGIDLNGDKILNESEDYLSAVLVASCELDENGSLVDEDCAVSAIYPFSLNATVGSYQYWVIKNANNTTTNWTYEIQVFEDIHDDEGPNPGDCFGSGCDDGLGEETEEVNGGGLSTDGLVQLTAIIAGIGAIFLALSIQRERASSHEKKTFEEE
jgi:hypothetical protein